MKNSEYLFQLIKSLDKNEKRYFRLFNSFHKGDKKYMPIYEAIEKQKVYNEKKIISKFKNEKLVQQFPFIKQYLYNLVLSSLESYHSNTDSLLQSHLHRIDILDKKGLYAQCEKVIAKAQQLAEKHEKYWFLAELKKRELIIIRAQSYLNCSTGNIAEHNRSLLSYINKYQNINDYLELSDNIFIEILQNNNVRNNLKQKALKNILKHPLLSSEKNAISIEALHRYYFIYGAYHYYIRSDYAKLYFYHQKIIDLLEANPAIIENKPELYISAIHNLASCQLQFNYYHDVSQNIQKLKNIASCPNKQLSKQLLYNIKTFNIPNLELDLYVQSGQFEKGRKLIPQLQGESQHPEGIPVGLSLNLIHTIALIYFGLGDYIRAKINLNKILNDTTYDVRMDLHCFAWILQLIVHYELEDMDFISYKVKSAQQFLAKREQLYKIEKLIVDFFRNQLPKAKTKKQQSEAFKKLKNQFTEIIKNPFERKALDYFDFISWLESKIENKPFAEIVKEKDKF